MEAKGLERQATSGGEFSPRRSARKSKGKRRADLKALTCELTRRFDMLESEQGHEQGDQDVGEGTSAEPLDKGRSKRRRTGAASSVEAGEGTSYGYDPYEDPATYTPGAAEAVRNEKRGEYEGTHSTVAQGVYWPWCDGQQQSRGFPNMGMTSPMAWPGGFWPQVAPQWFGWGMPFSTPEKHGSTKEGREFNITQHPSVPTTGYNSAPFLATPYTDYSTPLGDHLTPAIKERI